jgi:hypothetical protein
MPSRPALQSNSHHRQSYCNPAPEIPVAEVVINSNGLSWMPIGHGWMELVRWALPTAFDGVLEFGIAEKLPIG